jgi:glycosyltransferase involved in cell wall biosynthesis
MPALGVQVRPRIPIEVIPTCADLQRFTPGTKDPDLLMELGLAGVPVIGCVGTMGNWYMRGEMLDALAFLSRTIEKTKILIVTRDDHAALRTDLEGAGVPADRLVLVRATFAEMPRYIRLFDAGLFFIQPTFSKTASAATKLAEFLGCGVPVIINDGVGDSGEIVRGGRVGVVLPSAATESLNAHLPEVRSLITDSSVAARCREIATELFDLDAGVERYRGLYRRLLQPQSPKS